MFERVSSDQQYLRGSAQGQQCSRWSAHGQQCSRGSAHGQQCSRGSARTSTVREGQRRLVPLKASINLQALVYDILPSTTAVFSYAIGSRKRLTSRFFVGARTVVSLLQTTQIKQGVSFIAANKVDTSTNKTTIV